MDIGCTTLVLNDDYWESHHPNSPMFTPLQQIPKSPVQTEEIHMGSDEPQDSLLTIPEEIPATSVDVNAAEEMETQATTEAEAEIPQPAPLKLKSQKLFFKSLTLLSHSRRIHSPRLRSSRLMPSSMSMYSSLTLIHIILLV